MSEVLQTNKRIRYTALALGAVAIGFYVGIIVLLFYRSHH